MKVRVLRSHPYCGVTHKKGAEYFVGSERDLNVLVGLGHVEIIGDELPKQAYNRKDLTAQTISTQAEKTTKKRSYRRKSSRAKINEEE